MEGIKHIKIDGKQIEMQTTVYTVLEVAEVLKVSKRTVYNEITSNKLKAIKVRGCIRITSKSLENYLEEEGVQ